MRRTLFALFLVVAACGPAPDPATAPRAVTPLGLEPPPVYSLLGFREEIGLTSEQITALDSIAEAVRQENAPLVQELRDRNPARAEQRGFILVDTAAQPMLQQVRENNRAAAAAVGEILTEEQRATACRIFDDNRRDRFNRPGPAAREQRARRQSRRRMTEPEDSAWVQGRVGWTWCAPAAPPTEPPPAA